MVMLFEWYRTAMDQKSRSSLPMIGEDTDLEALASPLVGYLGKVQKRASSLEFCPWCTSKGLTSALRSYCINPQESITLCTNPQCLFPLVSRSLEDVLASLIPVEPTTGSKRKNALALEKEDLIKPANKRRRSSELDSLGPQITTDSLFSQVEHSDVSIVSNGKPGLPKTDGEKVNECQRDSPVAETTGWDSAQNEDDALDKEPEIAAFINGFAPTTCSVSAQHLQSSPEASLAADSVEPALSRHHGPLGVLEGEGDFRQVRSPPEALNIHCILDNNQSFITKEKINSTEINILSPQDNTQTVQMGHKSLAADVPTCKDIKDVQLETEDLSSITLLELAELVPVPHQLFWSNSNNLCWLDSMLVALVNCKALRKCKPKVDTQQSPVWQLIRGYDDVRMAIQFHQQLGKDGIMRVQDDVLQKAFADLQSLRMSAFKMLQPKLHCKLGQRETPVFALPLLLAMDTWAEPLFQSTFHWEFECSECKTATKERAMKTLPTCTNILPDWRPLQAVHLAPCNVCSKKNQRRAMMLESVPPVFGLHFVQGLPDNDVNNYCFTFKGKHYSITTVIQYNQQLKHFVTWICNTDGSWLEYDDLKHPECKTHEKLPVSGEEIHIVLWEVEEDKEPLICSPSSTFSKSPTKSINQASVIPGDEDLIAEEPLNHSLAQSLLLPHNDTDIVCALTASEDDGNTVDAAAAVDTSIGSTTLLDTFEGLTHSDIITLTLVEVKADSDVQLVNNHGQTQEPGLPRRNEIPDSAPDSSSTVKDALCDEAPATSNSSEIEDDTASDPTFVPGSKKQQGRGKPVGRQTGKKVPLTKAALPFSSPASSEPSTVISNKPAGAPAAQGNTPPLETTQQGSIISSTDSSLTCTSLKSATILPPPLQNSRWSFLLSKHPLRAVKEPGDGLGPARVTQAKLTLPTHSTPNPLRRQQTPEGLFPKPQLRAEESDGLPLKAAEMYDAFGVKSLTVPVPLQPSPEFCNGKSKLFQPVTTNYLKPLINTTVVSDKWLPSTAAKSLSDISSTKKRSSRSSKVPPGLSETEALRYKLIKKLKAKKKKLAKLNEMLRHQGAPGLRPDSTDLGSPNTVTSSTYDGSICDDMLLDLLSPATTASNLSPDSTGFLEMLASGQGAEHPGRGPGVVGTASQVNTCTNEPNTENFLDDFLSQAVAQRPTEMETEALSALDLFV